MTKIWGGWELEDPQDFGALGERLGLQLHSVDVRAMALLTERLSAFGVTPARASAIIYIALHEGCDQAALGRALAINRATTMKLVDALEAIGAVARRIGRDRRTNALHLTASGQALRRQIERQALDHEEIAFAGLSVSERCELKRLLAKLRQDQVEDADRADLTPLVMTGSRS